VSEKLAKEAFDLAYAQLRSQKEDLKNYRNQASICCAVTGLIASFFASFSRLHSINVFGCFEECLYLMPFSVWALLSLITLSIVSAVAAIISWQEVKFDLDPDTILHSVIYYDKLPSPETTLFVSLARDANKFFDENEDVLDDVKLKLAMSFLLGWAQIPIWIIVIY
jgi:hypothetical protein